MEIGLNRHLFKEKLLEGCLSGLWQPWAPSCSSLRSQVVAGAAFAGGKGFVGWCLCILLLHGCSGPCIPPQSPLQPLWWGNGSRWGCSA